MLDEHNNTDVQGDTGITGENSRAGGSGSTSDGTLKGTSESQRSRGKDMCRGRRNPFDLRETFQDQGRHVNINHTGRASQFKCWWTETNGRHFCRRFLTPFQTALPFRPVGSGGQHLIRREWRTIHSSRQYYLFVKLSFLLSPSTLGMSSFYSSL